MIETDYSIERLSSRIRLWGIVLCLVTPLILNIVSYFVFNVGIDTTVSTVETQMQGIAFWGSLGLGLALILTIKCFKTRYFNIPIICDKESYKEDFYRQMLLRSRILFVAGAALSSNGAALYLASHNTYNLLLFFCFSVISFYMFRPRIDFLRKIHQNQYEKLMDDYSKLK